MRFAVCLLLATLAIPLSASAAGDVAPDFPAIAAAAAPSSPQAFAAPRPAGQQPQVVYLVQPQASAAAPATSSSSSAPSAILGVLSAVPIESWALILGLGALAVFKILGDRGAKAAQFVDKWIDFAYYAAEAAARQAGPDSFFDKGAGALNAFHQGLLGVGVTPSPADIAKAQAAWAAQAAREHVAVDLQAKAAAQAYSSATERPADPPTPLAAS